MIYTETADLPGFSHMTIAEAERAAFQAGLPIAGALALLADADALRNSGIEAHLDEASAQFPEEDFLAETIREIQELALGMRGLNRAKLNAIAARLDEIQLNAGRSTEYGREELSKAEAILTA